MTPLLGGSDRGPCSYLLSINSFSILLDCGWAEPYDVQMLDPVRDRVGEIDAVLLSHADPAHCGALPYLIGKLGMAAPIYATGAIHKMGQMFMYDAYLNQYASSNFESFNLDDVDAAFERITQLRYKQEVTLLGDHHNQQQLPISITPLPAGRLLGGTVWRIVVGGEELVYAMDFNHKRDRHLIGTPLESTFLRPAICIADAGASGRIAVDKEHVERSLLDACLSCLRGEGNVLIPVDAAGRVLELLLIFEEHWSKHKLPYPVVLLGPMVHTMLEFARSQLEWMNESLVKLLGHSRENPFLLRHIKLCASLAEFKRLPSSGPRVVLAVDASLNAGPARQLLTEWADNARTLIILPFAPFPMSMSAQILTVAELRDAKVGFWATLPKVEVTLSKRVALKGEELAEYRRLEAEQREAQANAEASGEVVSKALTLENMEENESMHQGSSLIGENAERSKRGKRSRGSVGSTAMGESPRASSFYQQPTRANVMSIGHAARDSMGFMDVDDAMLMNPGAVTGSFDLELDGVPEDAGACLIEGFDVGLTSTMAPLFPNEDEWEKDAAQFDEYGAPVDLAALTGEGEDQGRLGRALASEAEAERGEFVEIGDGIGGGQEDHSTPLERDIPTKIESTVVSIDLAAKIIRFDLDGRADDRSVRNILTHIAPQNIILVHAEEEPLGTMARRLETELEGLNTSVKLVSTADKPVTVSLGSSFEVQLAEDVMDGVEMHAVSGYDLGWVDGKLDLSHSRSTEGEENGGQTEMALLPVLHASNRLVAGVSPTADDHGADEGDQAYARYGGVFIGDVRLSELKKALALAGVRSEFHGGGLFCQGNVVVRRHGDAGGLLLEGVIGEEYYTVRDVIYGQYHIC